MTPPVAVVHLVRHGNEPASLETFVASYERFSAGADHDLVLLLKGFPSRADAAWVLDRASDCAPTVIDLPDDGFDLGAYVAAAQRLSHRWLCFMNSHSELLAPDWLHRLTAPLQSGAAGIAGATGSWGSQLGYELYQLGAGGGYAEMLGERASTHRTMLEIAGSARRGRRPSKAFSAFRALQESRAGALFPAVHVRTNAFAVERELLLSLRTGAIRTKLAAYRLESGRLSLTSQVRDRDRDAVVVDRHGVTWTHETWPQAEAFWQGAQRGLLVADNQTRSYERATAEQRRVLSAYAWGLQARPAAD